MYFHHVQKYMMNDVDSATLLQGVKVTAKINRYK